jgi:hypothetical protein
MPVSYLMRIFWVKKKTITGMDYKFNGQYIIPNLGAFYSTLFNFVFFSVKKILNYN